MGKIGFHGEFSKTSVEYNADADVDDSEMKINGYGMNFNVGLLYALTNSVNFSFGLNLDTAFGGTYKEDGVSVDGMKVTGVSFYPYIGVAYLF